MGTNTKVESRIIAIAAKAACVLIFSLFHLRSFILMIAGLGINLESAVKETKKDGNPR